MMPANSLFDTIESTRLQRIDDSILSYFANPYASGKGLAKALASTWVAPSTFGFTQDQIRDYMADNDVSDVQSAIESMKQERISASAQKPITFDHGGRTYTIKPSEVNKLIGGGSRPGRINLGGGEILSFGYDKDPVTGEYLGTVKDFSVDKQNPERDWMDTVGGLILGAMTGGAASLAGLGATAAGAIGGATSGFASSGGDLSSALKGGLLGGAGGYIGGQFSGAGASGYDAGAAMDAGIAQGAANAGYGATTFPIDMSGQTNLGDTAGLAADQVDAMNAGGNMSWDIGDLYNEFIDAGYTADEAAQLAQETAGWGADTAIQGATGGMLDAAGNITAAGNAGLSLQKQIADALGVFNLSPADAASMASKIAGVSLGDVSKAKNILKLLGTGGGSAAKALPVTTLKKMLNGESLTDDELSGMLSTGLNLGGSYLAGQAAKDAAKYTADQQLAAAKLAADAAKFRPVGVTTNFGSSTFKFDPTTGYLSSAGYTLTPEMKALQDKLIGSTSGLLSQFTDAKTLTAPMKTAAENMMTLGNKYLATDPAAQAKKYLDDQQALLKGVREQQLSALQNKLLQQGRLGLATGATSTGMMATNPEMAAYQNAIQQQDLQLAANATQGGMDYAKFGQSMVGLGGNMLRDMYGTQTAAYNPFQTALGGAIDIEKLGQNALQAGIDLGSTTTAANAKAGSLLGQGMQNAAATMQPANAYSPWGALLSGAGQQMQAYRFDPFTGKAL